MAEKVVLEVDKNSPHIWAGNLQGRELAHWLLGKANAILALENHRERLNEAREDFIGLQASEKLFTSYANLGLSLQASDPIHPLSMEAIQFDREIGGEFQRLARSSLPLAGPMFPFQYQELSDLREAQEEFHQKKAALSAQVSGFCE